MLTPNCSRTQGYFSFLKQANSIGIYTRASGTVVKTTTVDNSSPLLFCICMQFLAMVLHFCSSFTYECPRKHVRPRALGAANSSRSFLTFREKNQRTCRHCPGVSQHMTPYPVLNTSLLQIHTVLFHVLKEKALAWPPWEMFSCKLTRRKVRSLV